VARVRAAQLDAAYRTGDFAGVERLLDEALRAAAEEGDRAAEAAAIDQRGEFAYRRAAQRPREERRDEDIDSARDAFERALAIRRELGDMDGAAESLFHLGRLAQVLRGDHATAFRLLRQALPLAAGSVLTGDVHLHIGVHVEHWGDGPAAALPHLEQAVSLWRGQPEPGLLVVALVTLAWCELHAGLAGQAAAHAREALDLARGSGLRERYVRRAEAAVSAAEAASGEGRREPISTP
jgi:tetratricopeptide (TPR) repeat protein